MKYIKLLLIGLMLFTSQAHSKDILISFDGSASLAMWQDTLDYAKENNIKFTYFVSAPYFVSENDQFAKTYWAPAVLGRMPVAFRKTERAYGISKRFEYIKRARSEGHEIGSHLVGYYDGRKWTKEQWEEEIRFFNNTFFAPGTKPYMIGIRAPELGINQAYFEALGGTAAPYIQYDSSVVYSKAGYKYNFGTVKELPIRQIAVEFIPPYMSDKPVYTLPFDYNFEVLLSPTLTSEEVENIFFHSLVYDYIDNPEKPMMICLHFEQMRGGAYYRAMKRFVEWARDRENDEPHYRTYKEYIDIICCRG